MKIFLVNFPASACGKIASPQRTLDSIGKRQSWIGTQGSLSYPTWSTSRVQAYAQVDFYRRSFVGRWGAGLLPQKSDIIGLHVESASIEEFENMMISEGIRLIIANHMTPEELATKQMRGLLPVIIWKCPEALPAAAWFARRGLQGGLQGNQVGISLWNQRQRVARILSQQHWHSAPCSAQSWRPAHCKRHLERCAQFQEVLMCWPRRWSRASDNYHRAFADVEIPQDVWARAAGGQIICEPFNLRAAAKRRTRSTVCTLDLPANTYSNG
jgi:hypothetical protein